MIRRPPRSTLDRSSAASDVYKRQVQAAAAAVAPQAVGAVGDVLQLLQDEVGHEQSVADEAGACLLYTSPSPRDRTRSRIPSSS